MSKGPGAIEQRIAELFAATRDRGLTVADIADHAFALAGQPATRAQRLSATRAAHRLLRRMKETKDQAQAAIKEAHREVKAALGRKREASDAKYDAALEANLAFQGGKKLRAFVEQFGSWTRFIRVDRDHFRCEEEFWRATVTKDGHLYLHPPDAPVKVWAVSIQPAGVIWADAEVGRITERNVTVRYAGETARLDRERLWKSWAFWRGVRFVSSRTGRAAGLLDAMWQDRYGRAAGGVPPVMQMPLAEAIALLRVPADYQGGRYCRLPSRSEKGAS